MRTRNRKPKLGRQELTIRVNQALNSGAYVILPHARQRCDEREVSLSDIEFALELGHPVPRRDRWDSWAEGWGYCFEGPTIDQEQLRVIIAFEDLMLVVTVVRLGQRGGRINDDH